jgi:hypothetical protein
VAYLIRDFTSYFMHVQGSIAILLFIGLVLTSTVIAAITINPYRWRQEKKQMYSE